MKRYGARSSAARSSIGSDEVFDAISASARGALDCLEHNLLDIDALEDCLENEVDITDRTGDVVGQRDATDAFQHSRLDQSHLDVPAHTLRQLRPTRRW